MQPQRRSSTIAGETLSVSITINKSNHRRAQTLQVDQGSCIFPKGSKYHYGSYLVAIWRPKSTYYTSTWTLWVSDMAQSSHPCNPEASALPFPTPRPSPESPDVFGRTKDLHASDQNRIHRTSCCDHHQIIRSDKWSPDTEIPCSRPWNFDNNEKQKQTARPHPKALNSEISHPAAPS